MTEDEIKEIYDQIQKNRRWTIDLSRPTFGCMIFLLVFSLIGIISVGIWLFKIIF